MFLLQSYSKVELVFTQKKKKKILKLAISLFLSLSSLLLSFSILFSFSSCSLFFLVWIRTKAQAQKDLDSLGPHSKKTPNIIKPYTLHWFCLEYLYQKFLSFQSLKARIFHLISTPFVNLEILFYDKLFRKCLKRIRLIIAAPI